MIHHTIQNFSGEIAKPSHISVVYGADWRCVRLEERSTGKSLYDFKEREGEDLHNLLTEYSEAKIKLAFASSRFALIPNDTFDYNQVNALAAGHFFKEQEEVLEVDSVYNQGLKNIYVPNGQGSGLSHVQCFHLISPILSFLPNNKNRVYFFHLGTEAILVAFNQGELKTVKVVTEISKEVALYQIVDTFQGSGLHPHQHELFLAGRVLPESAMVKLLGRFIQHVNYLNIPGWSNDNPHVFYDAYLLSKYF